jgi:hypothetical protein
MHACVCDYGILHPKRLSLYQLAVMYDISICFILCVEACNYVHTHNTTAMHSWIL